MAFPQALASTLYGLAILGVAPEQAWIDQYLSAVQRRRKGLTGTSMSAILWALLKMKAEPGAEFLDTLTKHAHSQAPRMPASAIISILHSLSQCGHKPPVEYLEAFSGRVKQLVADESQEIGAMELKQLKAALDSFDFSDNWIVVKVKRAVWQCCNQYSVGAGLVALPAD